MATSQNLHGNSHSSQTWIPNSLGSTPTSSMNDLRPQLTAAQTEAQQILQHLLSRLKDPNSKYYARYGKWAQRHPSLDAFCLHCIRPQVWTYLSSRWSLDALKLIAGDLRSDSRAIYLNGVLGLDKRMRVYIGQASSLRPRIAQHLNFRYRRDNPSLHYHALQSSIYNAIGVLAVLPGPSMGNQTLPGMDDPSLLLNVLEMWMCLVFRSLLGGVMEEWIPEGVNPARKEGKEGVFGGLNIRSPLDQGDSRAEWVDLSESDDPLVQEYLGVGAVEIEEKLKATEDIKVRKKEYAKKAKNMNQSQNEATLSANTLIVFAVGVVLGFALAKGLEGPVHRR